ncbi:MAG TPA: hypothetical protein VM165_01840 [Planctomycetaceae bacterium]|nr:hypothetical protein [Planctomycetaceae bacterium]
MLPKPATKTFIAPLALRSFRRSAAKPGGKGRGVSVRTGVGVKMEMRRVELRHVGGEPHREMSSTRSIEGELVELSPVVERIPKPRNGFVLTRQKVVLAAIDFADRPVSSIELVKWMFLLRLETRIGQESSFYDFVPYRFGPFSFALYRELSALRRDGLLTEQQPQVSLSQATRRVAKERARELPRPWLDAIRETVSHRVGQTQDELLHDVYKRYPWYATKSELTYLRPAFSTLSCTSWRRE